MAHSADTQRERLRRLCDLLSGDERRRCLFLCGTCDLDRTLPCLEEFLTSEVVRSHDSELFLTEMFMRLGRFDILRQEFGIHRDQMEKNPAKRTALSKFRVLMDSLSEDLDKGNLDQLKFLLSGMFRQETTDMKSFLDMVIALEKLGAVSPENVDLIEDYLTKINRVDLAGRVRKYKLAVGPSYLRAAHQKTHVTSPIPESCVQRRRCEPLQTSAPNNVQAFVSRESCSPSPLDWYSFKTNPRGVCLIIDCVGYDGEMLEHTFKSLQFRVELYKWLTVEGALLALERFRGTANLVGDSFVCCIISRGTADHLLATEDNKTDLSLNKVKHHFSVCPVMTGKPKMFFIQRYSASESESSWTHEWDDDELEVDGPSIPQDMFWSHCWTNEQQLQGGRHCSLYLKELTNAIMEGSMRRDHLVDVHKEVTRIIDSHNCLNPKAQYHIDYKNTLTKKLYL
ncbi:CASP8 and FADD-like apoptosis regulator [Neosynchiropus ocellatus]